MTMWLSGLSSPISWTILVLLGSGLSVAALVLVRKIKVRIPSESNNDVIGFVHGIIGVLYAVLLAFTIVVGWEQYARTERNIGEEVGIVGDLYNDYSLMLEDFQDENDSSENGSAVTELAPTGVAVNTIESALDEYLEATVYSNWAPNTWEEVAYADTWKAFRLYAQTTTMTAANAAFFAEALRKLNELGEHRQARILDANRTQRERFWALLLIGAVVTVALTLLYRIDSMRLHVVLVGSLAGLISVSLALVLSLDRPFGIDGAVLKEPYKTLCQQRYLCLRES